MPHAGTAASAPTDRGSRCEPGHPPPLRGLQLHDALSQNAGSFYGDIPPHRRAWNAKTTREAGQNPKRLRPPPPGQQPSCSPPPWTRTRRHPTPSRGHSPAPATEDPHRKVLRFLFCLLSSENPAITTTTRQLRSSP